MNLTEQLSLLNNVIFKAATGNDTVGAWQCCEEPCGALEQYVECSADNVEAIVWRRLLLGGTLADELAQLTSLLRLNVIENYVLHGTLPSLPASLELLYAFENMLSGTLRESLAADLPNLRVLSLRDNDFYSTLPPLPASLEQLQVGANAFFSTLPLPLPASLTHFVVSENNLTLRATDLASLNLQPQAVETCLLVQTQRLGERSCVDACPLDVDTNASLASYGCFDIAYSDPCDAAYYAARCVGGATPAPTASLPPTPAPPLPPTTDTSGSLDELRNDYNNVIIGFTLALFLCAIVALACCLLCVRYRAKARASGGGGGKKKQRSSMRRMSGRHSGVHGDEQAASRRSYGGAGAVRSSAAPAQLQYGAALAPAYTQQTMLQRDFASIDNPIYTAAPAPPGPPPPSTTIHHYSDLLAR